MATAAESQGLSPGFKFNPSVEQLLRFFLLPYLQHQRLLVDGVVFVDDPASAPPWALLHRHGRGSEDEAYFIGPVPSGEGHRRQQVSRTVTGGGGGKWIKQKTEHSGKRKRVVFGGETFGWEEFSLNFHADERCRSGSTGWVMHEFAVVPPPGSRVAATHTACHIAFTGHGQKRKRVPDGYVFIDVQVQTAAGDVPPPSPMLCSFGEPPHSGASHDEHFSDEQPPPLPPHANTQEHQRFLATAEQSNQEQEYFLLEQQNCQDYYVEAAEQSGQDYFYSEMINQEQGCNQQYYAYHQQQQHLFHGDPLATSRQFLDQDHEVMFIDLGGGLVVSDNGEHAAAPATEPPVHDVFLEPLVREPPENVYVDGAREPAMASACSAGGSPLLQQAMPTPQQFLDQEQTQAPAGFNYGGAVISNNNGDGENAAAAAAQPPARYYNGPVPTVDSVFLDKMREYLMADAKGLCRTHVEDAPTNGDHATAPAPAAGDPLAAQHGDAPPDTAELERVVGHLLREVEDIIKVAAAGGYGSSSDKPLSNFDKAQNQILAKLMAVFNQVAES
uniref:NAC domain-containing protein n=1 Tax=Oryza punctata TaxID=4537 RepID=A0A0E0JYK0_ORYPU